MGSNKKKGRRAKKEAEAHAQAQAVAQAVQQASAQGVAQALAKAEAELEAAAQAVAEAKAEKEAAAQAVAQAVQQASAQGVAQALAKAEAEAELEAAAHALAQGEASQGWRPALGIEHTECMLAFNVDWPCLSSDVIRADQGVPRNHFPHSLHIVAGTQVDQPSNNAIAVVRMTNFTLPRHKYTSLLSLHSSDEDEDKEEMPGQSDQAPQSKKPILQVRLVAHQGCVNKVRAMIQQPHIVATWADSGYVQAHICS